MRSYYQTRSSSAGAEVIWLSVARCGYDAPRAQPRHAMLQEIAIISLEDRRPLRHVSLSEGEGGDEDERREVEAVH
jgi:hypothetical protein